MQKQGNKLLGLEVIRFVCAVAVLFWHYQHFSFPDSAAGFTMDRQPFFPLFSFLYKTGYMGVPIFWCISGFIFFWKYKDSIADRRVGPRKFFIMRFSRLYPLHFATLLIVALLQIVFLAKTGAYFIFQKNDILHFILQLFMASNWASTTTQGDSFNGPIWSISVEVLIYCFFFLTLRHVGRSAVINAVIVSICLAAKFAKIPTPIIDCLAFFYIGGLSAIALQKYESTRYQKVINPLAMAVVVVVPVFAIATAIYQKQHFAFLFLISYVPILLYVCAQNVSVPAGVQRFVEAAGNMTYSSYLVHFPIQLLIALWFAYQNRAMPYESPLMFFVFFGTTLVASYCVYRFYELPAQNLIRARFK